MDYAYSQSAYNPSEEQNKETFGASQAWQQ